MSARSSIPAIAILCFFRLCCNPCPSGDGSGPARVSARYFSTSSLLNLKAFLWTIETRHESLGIFRLLFPSNWVDRRPSGEGGLGKGPTPLCPTKPPPPDDLGSRDSALGLAALNRPSTMPNKYPFTTPKGDSREYSRSGSSNQRNTQMSNYRYKLL